MKVLLQKFSNQFIENKQIHKKKFKIIYSKNKISQKLKMKRNKKKHNSQIYKHALQQDQSEIKKVMQLEFIKINKIKD